MSPPNNEALLFAIRPRHKPHLACFILDRHDLPGFVPLFDSAVAAQTFINYSTLLGHHEFFPLRDSAESERLKWFAERAFPTVQIRLNPTPCTMARPIDFTIRDDLSAVQAELAVEKTSLENEILRNPLKSFQNRFGVVTASVAVIGLMITLFNSWTVQDVQKREFELARKQSQFDVDAGKAQLDKAKGELATATEQQQTASNEVALLQLEAEKSRKDLEKAQKERDEAKEATDAAKKEEEQLQHQSTELATSLKMLRDEHEHLAERTGKIAAEIVENDYKLARMAPGPDFDDLMMKLGSFIYRPRTGQLSYNSLAVLDDEKRPQLIVVGDCGAVVLIDAINGDPKTITSDSFLDLNDVCVASENCNHICIVGQSGLILTSQDRGKTWKRRAVSSADLFAVACSGDGNIIVAGARFGMIAYSTDGGEHWRVESAGAGQLKDVAVSSDGSRVLAVEGYGNSASLLERIKDKWVNVGRRQIWRPISAPSNRLEAMRYELRHRSQNRFGWPATLSVSRDGSDAVMILDSNAYTQSARGVLGPVASHAEGELLIGGIWQDNRFVGVSDIARTHWKSKIDGQDLFAPQRSLDFSDVLIAFASAPSGSIAALSAQQQFVLSFEIGREPFPDRPTLPVRMSSHQMISLARIVERRIGGKNSAVKTDSPK